MCGIAGILERDPSRAASPQLLEQMLQVIRHRGPDEDGTLIDQEVAMGMRRLSIIDLADGHQPIFDESGRYAVVFNGEIYNYRELRADLLARGHQLTTHSDTEVIVHLYEEQGERCVDALRGMFAFAIWDQQRRELFIARDRLGIKPLYYTEHGGTFLFGSEIKCLLQHPDLKAKLDEQSLSQYLSLKYVPSPRTLFEGIKSLLPGHCLRLSARGLETWQYWDFSFIKPQQPKSEGEYLAELKELLREAVRLRLRSDVPFGAFLSGGVDSSIIVALMAEQMDEPVKTFSVGFDGGAEADELPYAKVVADRFGCDHHTLRVTAKDFRDYAEQVIWHMDQPISDQATVATFMVAKLARQHVKMVLTGEGGDELFAGYARYQGEQYASWFQYLPAPLGKLMRRMAPWLPGLRRAKIALNALTIKDEATRFANWFPMFTDEVKQSLLTGVMREKSDGAAAIFREQLQRCDAQHPLERMLYVDTKLWLADYLLLRGDKLTMANSLEARVPLLDHKLVEFAARLPPDLKLRGKTRKYLLKQVAREFLPEGIVDRKKQGFPIPIDRWLRHECRDMVHDLLATDTIKRRGFFQPKFVKNLVEQHTTGFADHSSLLWGLMSLEMWMQMVENSGSSWRLASTMKPLTPTL